MRNNANDTSNANGNGLPTPAPSVLLPRRSSPPTLDQSKKAPIWAIQASAHPDVSTPLPAKCDRHGPGREGVCCKELKDDDTRHLIDPDIVRDVVIGLSDGLTVPFALAAGLSSLGDSRVVVLGGVAELIAGAISMGIGGFLASQAERDHFLYLRDQTSARILRSCAGELEREVHNILGPVGVDESLSRQVANALRNAELQSSPLNDSSAPSSASDQTILHDEEQGKLRWSNTVGLTPFLLKFGEGLEEVPTKRLYISAFTIGSGYFVGGLIPLLPYFFIQNAAKALVCSVLVTGCVLLLFGAVKTHVTGAKGGAGGYVYGAVSMLCVGGAAAGAAWGIVKALET